MSKKFLTNKLNEVDLKEFNGIDDYILLSNWLKSENVPLKITKRNFFSQSQRFLTNILGNKDQEEALTKALCQISKARLRQMLESISILNSENKPKKMHDIL